MLLIICLVKELRELTMLYATQILKLWKIVQFQTRFSWVSKRQKA